MSQTGVDRYHLMRRPAVTQKLKTRTSLWPLSRHVSTRGRGSCSGASGPEASGCRSRCVCYAWGEPTLSHAWMPLRCPRACMHDFCLVVCHEFMHVEWNAGALNARLAHTMFRMCCNARHVLCRLSERRAAGKGHFDWPASLIEIRIPSALGVQAATSNSHACSGEHIVLLQHRPTHACVREPRAFGVAGLGICAS